MTISIQKSFPVSNKTLFLIATPIGNLQEFTPRAISVLNSVDLVVCENTFSYKKLSKYFSINGKKIILYDNIKEKSENSIRKTIDEMIEYKEIALVSNAGYPLVSDPGRILVRKWIEKGYHVVPVSGSSAFINALVSSGFYYHNFTFIGFLPRKKSKQELILKIYVNNLISALIIYESANRLVKTLMTIKNILGNRLIAVCRELTKIHEEFVRGSIAETIDYFEKNSLFLKGEIVIIVSIETDSSIQSISFLKRIRANRKIKTKNNQ